MLWKELTKARHQRDIAAKLGVSGTVVEDGRSGEREPEQVRSLHPHSFAMS